MEATISTKKYSNHSALPMIFQKRLVGWNAAKTLKIFYVSVLSSIPHWVVINDRRDRPFGINLKFVSGSWWSLAPQRTNAT